MPFPKAVDYHKPGRPEVPNGLGIFYVIASSAYLFSIYFAGSFWGFGSEAVREGALPLASCILFGGFLGLVDDWMDLRWRYKAFTPIVASLPLIALRQGYPVMATYIFGKIDFRAFGLAGLLFYYAFIIPAIVTVTTNTVNQLGGLNGLETLCPLVVMAALAAVAPDMAILLAVPMASLAVLAYFNFRGRIFVGNVGSFSFGITLASFAIIANREQALLISIIPYVLNSILILANYFFRGKLPRLSMTPEGLLYSDHIRSLQTLLCYKRPKSERVLVAEITLLFVLSSSLAVAITFL
ncbi:hypothetical protein DRO33_03150 [Candidatus Bathyarchaeota archaeon]|nr:MAG: hypothetical protein DRO33_03150 [Candidatus Bathyarchaeota archaeon]